ncbi:MAG TPA: fumarylacetoacetate hydrolase family protein [Pseudomonadales bacterium]|nr:fumarylacetoacetate hydrolase family protein [Pseudomonadales bacterium]
MSYQHRFVDQTPCNLPVGKAVCVGRNYAAHAAELNNPVPERPILFIKPRTAIVDLLQPLKLPTQWGAAHHETELVVLIGETLTHADEAQAKQAIAGYGIGLDLTLRDLQNQLKEKAHPWEIAKAFDGAAPLSPFVKPDQIPDPQQVEIKLEVNGVVKQQGAASDMLNPVIPLIAYMSQFFTLEPGDVIFTGTPAGVGPLQAGDQLKLSIVGVLEVETQVA